MADFAFVYQRGSWTYVGPVNRTDHGLAIDGQPTRLASSSLLPDALGGAILAALRASRAVVPNPENWREYDRAFLRWFDVKSLRSFHRLGRHVSVERSERIRFNPSEVVDPKNGFRGLPGENVELSPDATAHDIGAGALQALRRCRPAE